VSFIIFFGTLSFPIARGVRSLLLAILIVNS